MKLHSLTAAALLCLASASHAGIIHQYELNGNLKDAKDASLSKDLVSLGGTLGAQSYAFSANKGLALQYALAPVYTIDMSFQLAGATGSYQRLLNWAYGSPDHGLYVYKDHFCFYRGGCLDGSTFAPNKDIRLTVTRDAASMVTFYQNGKTLFSFQDNTGETLADGSRRLSFFKDDGSGEAATGSVDFIHIYDNALSLREVQALNPGMLPEPASLGLVGAGLALVGWTRRRRERGAA